MKKGISTISNTLAHLLLLLFLFAALVGVSQKIADNKGFEMQKQARDVALTITAASAAPGEISVIKHLGTNHNVTVNQEACIVSVTDPENKFHPTSYACSKTDNLQIIQEGNKLRIET